MQIFLQDNKVQLTEGNHAGIVCCCQASASVDPFVSYKKNAQNLQPFPKDCFRAAPFAMTV